MGIYLGSKRVDYIMTTPEKPSQEKTIEFENTSQVVRPDFGYNLTKVTITPRDISKANIEAMKEIDLAEINQIGGYELEDDWTYAEIEQEFQSLANIIMYGEEYEKEDLDLTFKEENISMMKLLDFAETSLTGGQMPSEEEYWESESRIQALANIALYGGVNA